MNTDAHPISFPATKQPAISAMSIGQLRDVLLYSEDKLERASAVTWFEFRVQQESFQELSSSLRAVTA